MTRQQLRTDVKKILKAKHLSIPRAAKQIGVHANTLGSFLRVLSCSEDTFRHIENWAIERSNFSISDILPKR